MLRIMAITMTLLLLGTGLARPFVGVFASGNYITNGEGYDPPVVSLGAQAGVHNLLGLFGARDTVAGVDLAGVFAEALPTLWLQTGTGTVIYDLRARAGYNFHCLSALVETMDFSPRLSVSTKV